MISLLYPRPRVQGALHHSLTSPTEAERASAEAFRKAERRNHVLPNMCEGLNVETVFSRVYTEKTRHGELV